MIPEHRQTYNAAFSPARYHEMLADIERQLPGQLDFRVAETPVFIPAILRDKLIAAGESIINIIEAPNFKALTEASIPAHQRVPGNEGRPEFLTFDFAVCRNSNGELEPQLIEMQGFPSLYAFQSWLPSEFSRFFPVADSVTPFIDVSDFQQYQTRMRQLILGDEPTENVILLELFPEKQKTRVDFALSKKFWGIDAICLTKFRRKAANCIMKKMAVKLKLHEFIIV